MLRRAMNHFTPETRHLAIWRSQGLVAGVALGLGPRLLRSEVAAQTRGAVEAPMFEVDPFWPKPLPNHWVLGAAVGVWVDAQDHVWMVHRGGQPEHPQRSGNETALQRDVLRDCAARSWSSIRRATCSGTGDPDRTIRGWTRSTASTSTTRTTCGWAEAVEVIPRF